MPESIHVLGAYWCKNNDLPTPLGELIAAAKDHGSAAAVTKLQEQLAEFTRGLNLPTSDGGSSGDILVVPVPNGSADNRRLVRALAGTVATALGATLREVLTRRNTTVRLRDTPPHKRLAVVEAAGYEITSPVVGNRVVLVDDVLLTGTTLEYLAKLLRDAGATSVVAVVAARTRRAGH